MSDPKTKTVLGRVFTRMLGTPERWTCDVKTGWVTLERRPHDGSYLAVLHDANPVGDGPTESDAILALQSTLRKMAELEVAE